MATCLPSSAPGRRRGLAALVTALVPAATPVATARPPAAHPPGRCGPHDEVRRALHTLTARDRIAGAAVLVTTGHLPAADVTCDQSVGRAPPRPAYPNWPGW
ncbi:hypothetical protein [Streptomyces sp. NPDC001480]|uniref:hypothetical protein n=1 Tax=Streptomyces sp. NPDC001480 TaxID=3364577 RepID=UPI0036BBCFC4